MIFIDGGGLLVRQDFHTHLEFYKGLKEFREKKAYVLHPFNSYVTNIDSAMIDAYSGQDLASGTILRCLCQKNGG